MNDEADQDLANGARPGSLVPYILGQGPHEYGYGQARSVLLLLWTTLFLSACHHIPLRQPVRVPDVLPDEVRQRLYPDRAAKGLILEPFDEAPSANHGVYRRWKFRFQSNYDDVPEVSGEYYQISSATAEAPSPLVQIAPILGGALDGYLTTRIFADWAAHDGFSSFFIYQEEIVLQPERDGAALEGVLRRTTRENVQALHLFASRPEVDNTRLGCFGVSMGAIKNVLLLAVEPRLRGGVLLLAGGDLARIVRYSREELVLRYVRGRVERGLTRDEVVQDLRAHLQSDPIHMAPHVGADRVFMVLGSLDDKVPYATGLALHAALDQPELHVYPLGHYTGILAAPRAARVGLDWLRKRLSGKGI